MGSTFGGIVNAGTALNAARYGLDIVSQNIANATTAGYTRQAAQQAAVDAVPGVPTIFTPPAGPGGVTVVATNRMNDPVVDARLRLEQSRSGLADTTASQLSQLESIFNEPSDTGLSEQLNDFWNSWSSVANDPGATAPRTVLLQKAATVVGTLNTMNGMLANVVGSTAQSLTQDTTSAASVASQLATLNGQIAVATATGAAANALLDQRDVLLSSLSTLVGGVATLNPNGSADVLVGGQPLVTGATAATLAVGPGYSVTVGGTPVTLTGGSVAAETTALLTTYPAFQTQLDGVANGLVATANAAQAAGFDLYGAPGAALLGGSGAAGISVAMTDPKQIAAASTAGGNLDGSNALATAKLGTLATGPDTLYTTLVGDVGAQSALAAQHQKTQATVTSSVSALQRSVSAVSTDEEVSSMLTYQHAYSAASRVLTTMDDLLDQLINHTGHVGQS